RGSVELKGGSLPAIGTTVDFSYTKAGGGGDTIPRSLRVLSAMVDPYRQTTKVELGCALTYFANRKPPTENPNSKEENAAVPCYVYNYATLPISASYVLQQCADALGLTLSSNPLTNKFSVEEFDLSAGYVQVMSDLLVSENHFGMVRSGNTLEIFSFDDPAMTGPIITDADIIDLGPVGVGGLAGDSARVSYTTRKLKAPDPDATSTEEILRRRWEAEVSYGATQETTLTYLDSENVYQTVAGTFTPYRAIYSTYDTWDRLMCSVTYELSISSDVSPRWAGGVKAQVPVERIQVQKPQYKVPAPSGPLDTFDPYGYLRAEGEQALAAYLSDQSDADTGTAAECIANTKPDDYSDVVQTVTETYISPLQLAASMNIEGFRSDTGEVTYTSPEATILESRTIVVYDKDPSSGITRTRTERYQIEGNTLTGQQNLALVARDSIDYSSLLSLFSSVEGLLILASQMRPVAVETLIRTEREYGLQKRPSQSDRNNSANAKEDPAESVTETTWDVGSVETEATQEFTLPYAPDDVISWTELGGYTSTPSDAEEKARAFGRIQNRLLLGNRAALALQLDPIRLPDAPFDPIYVQAAGITGQYRLNGCSWAMTGDGVIASTDALYWGAVGADPGTTTSWVPLPPGMTASDLPATPAPD
ncbi:MAG: hypothetical protein RL434_2601, partial [Pseudomonadota bacterium]